MERRSGEDVLEWMRRDWQERAARDALGHVYSASSGADEAAFTASGRLNYRQLVRPYLPILLNGRPANQCSVVEIGCGVGRMTRCFAEDFREVAALDISEEMIRLAQTRLADLSNVTFHVGSGRDLAGLAAESCDLAFSYIVFQHIPSREVVESYMREAARVLKPGGFFKFQVQGYAAEPRVQPPDTWVGVAFSQQEAEEMLRRCGFSLVASEGGGTQYFMLTARKGPAFASSGPHSYVFPGESWARAQTLEGWREPVGASWRCVWEHSRTLLAVPRGRRLRFFAGLYFGLLEPFEPMTVSIRCDNLAIGRWTIGEGGDFDIDVAARDSLAGREAVEITIDAVPIRDPNVGPALRCMGIYAERSG